MRGVLLAELLVARTELYPSLTRVTSRCNVGGHGPDDFISKVGTNESTRETRGCLRDNIEKLIGPTRVSPGRDLKPAPRTVSRPSRRVGVASD